MRCVVRGSGVASTTISYVPFRAAARAQTTPSRIHRPLRLCGESMALLKRASLWDDGETLSGNCRQTRPDLSSSREHPFKGVLEILCGCSLTMTSHLIYRATSTLPMPTRGDPTAVSISPEGSFIAVGSTDGHVFVWCSRTYELFCQASPPVGEDESTGSCVTNMTWMTNGLLAFSRENGLISILLVGKVRKSAW